MKVFVSKNWIPASAGMTKNQKGFTLIEIIILIVMAGILLPAIIVPFVTGVRASGKPEMVTRAMYLGHQRMEELMKYDYDRTPDLDPTNNPPTDFVVFPTGDANYPGENQIYYVDSDFNVVGDGKAAANNRGYKRICVRVVDPEGTTYEVVSVVTNFP
jgi:prepilin-type N-terminal cleavage/methylation domain-containing protein